MAKPKIVWTETATKQLQITLQYWIFRNQSNRYSKRIASKVKERLRILAKFPLTGIETEWKNTRKIVVEHFSIFYEWNEDMLIIKSFWDNRQDPETLKTWLDKFD